MSQKVVILGASDNPERYSYKAMKMLKEYGHFPILVNPRLNNLEGEPVLAGLKYVSGEIDTLTMYVSREVSALLQNDILLLNPKRVIFNPGSENWELAEVLKKQGIHVVEGCTLVLLRTKQFDKA